MSKVFGFLAALFLLFAGYQAFSNFSDFQNGAISPAFFVLSFVGPLLMSAAMLFFARNIAKTIRDRE